MKIVKLSLVAAMTAGLCSVASANSLADALKNGKVSGEVAVTYETRKQDKEISPWASNYYSDTAYSVGSFALKYETGVWNNLSLTSKFRAYKTLFEGGEDEFHYKGKGDAAERFWEKDGSTNNIDAEELFLTYTPAKNVTVKAGRQFIATDWVNKTQDAVRVDASFGNTSLEAIWSARHGRVYSRDYRPMTKMNENKGVYKLGLTQKINENISVTAYDFIAPDVRDIYGAKVNLKFGDTAIRAHYAVNKDDNDSEKDSSIIDLMVSTSIAGFSPYAGFVKIDDDARFTHMAGETIIPFEEGDQMYLQGAETYYVGVSKSFGDLSATLLYGITKYDESNDYSGTKGNFKKDETTLWLGYPVTKDLKANLGYTICNEDKDDAATTDLNQLNVTLTYSF